MKLKIIISFGIALMVLGCGGGGGGGGSSGAATPTGTTIITNSSNAVKINIGSANGSPIFNSSALNAPVTNDVKQVPTDITNIIGG